MFGRKKMYKQGMQDTMEAYQAFGEKQERALAKIRKELQDNNANLSRILALLGDDVNEIYNFLSSKEKAALYKLNVPKDIKELESEEKYLLVAVLYTLAQQEQNYNEYQKMFVRSVRNYLGITNPQTDIDLSCIGEITDLETQKSIMQVCIEFLYLNDCGEYTDEQETFFDYFDVNVKKAQLLELEVAKMYSIEGPEGLCEKYGKYSVIDENANLYTEESAQEKWVAEYSHDKHRLTIRNKDNTICLSLPGKCFGEYALGTEYVYYEACMDESYRSNIYRFSIESKELKKISSIYWDGIYNGKSGAVHDEKLFFMIHKDGGTIGERTICVMNLEGEKISFPLPSNQDIKMIAGDGVNVGLLYDNKELFLLDSDGRKFSKISDNVENFVVYNGHLIWLCPTEYAGAMERRIKYVLYDISSKTSKVICNDVVKMVHMAGDIVVENGKLNLYYIDKVIHSLDVSF